MMNIEISPELPSPTERAIAKGKRTKRPRPSSSGDSRESLHYSSTGTEEDEDMANCLILLARGSTSRPPPTQTEIGICVYDCKTCDRTFPTFQALGGHRASHKRTKLAADTDRKKSPAGDDREEGAKQLGNKLTAKIHECSVCGSEFASGQALGGHMRRHRAAAPIPSGGSDAASPGVIGEKPRSVLALDLDLNLPAPPEVDDKCNQQPRMVFAAAALVDCHY